MLEKKTWKQAREELRRAKVALIPVGSIEQHGPHLPLGTDFLTAKALAEAAAEATGALCTPAIPVGLSEHHRQFWGTLWVAPEHFRGYMRGIAESLAHHGLRRVIYVNGHGGNLAALQEVCRELHLDGVYALVWQWWHAVAELEREIFPQFGSHAGEVETSMMLYLEGESVDRSALAEAAAGGPPRWGRQLFGTEVSFDTVDFSESGATGDPQRGTAEIGKRLFRAAVEQLVGLVRWLESLPEEALRPGEHKP
ncbi:MAG: creatininase family protein [Candidatus Acetothermia bacterium]|jgi:creatinine amidohydrolase|nr:creatininase family protein [Candidatus Acetothermia bacterium]MDH7505058.1 creatininase family protein [Candidatus Acetothermia bacterium]